MTWSCTVLLRDQKQNNLMTTMHSLLHTFFSIHSVICSGVDWKLESLPTADRLVEFSKSQCRTVTADESVSVITVLSRLLMDCLLLPSVIPIGSALSWQPSAKIWLRGGPSALQSTGTKVPSGCRTSFTCLATGRPPLKLLAAVS